VAITFKNSSPAGDLIAMLAGIKQLCEEKKSKAIIYQHIGMVGESYSGAKHPFENEQGLPVAMNEYMFNMLKPLLSIQDYIEDFVIYKGEQVDFDLDKGRLQIFTNMPKGSINRWIFHVYPQMACNLSKEWIYIYKKHSFNNKIIINHTFRHRNYLVNYFFLKRYEKNIVFVGLYDEYETFCKQWNLNIEYLKVNNFKELAAAIKSCHFFSGNQSFCFQIAEALKVPRVLELFEPMPNVIPIGDNAYDYYHQAEAEYYFDKLFNLP
jgi:hypothetical protein